jgi:hypothetical protein
MLPAHEDARIQPYDHKYISSEVTFQLASVLLPTEHFRCAALQAS